MNNYTKIADEQLITDFRNGDTEIMDYLMVKYKYMVRQKARAMYLMGGENEDLIQEGMIGLFKAIRDFKPENGAPFAAFAKLCVERQLYTAIEAAARMKNAPLNGYISLSEESENLMDGGIEDAVIEKASYQQIYSDVQMHLSQMERQVLELFLEGKNYTEIAVIMGKSDKSIDNALQRMKSKIRKVQSETKLTKK